MAAMPWPIRPTPSKLDGFADFFGSADFAGMHQPVKANARRLFRIQRGIASAGTLSSSPPIPNATMDFDAHRSCGFNHCHGGIGAELPNGIEDEAKLQAATGETVRRPRGWLQNSSRSIDSAAA